MKFCFNCGTQLEDQDTHCSACGKAQSEPTPVEKTNPSEPLEFLNQQPTQAEDSQASPSAEEEPHSPCKTKKKRIGLFVLLGILALLIITAVIGYFTDWFGFYTPMDKLALAIKRTFSAQSLTVEVEATVKQTNSTKTYNATLQYAVDYENQDISLLLQSKENALLLHEEQRYSLDGARSEKEEFEKEEIFDSVEELQEDGKTDWEKVIDKAELNEYIKGENMEPFFTAFYKEKMKNPQFQKEALGYSVTKNTYTFEPDVKEIWEATFEVAKEKNLFTSTTTDKLDQAEDQLDLVFEALNDIDYTFTVTLSGKYVSSITYHVSANGTTLDITLTFLKVNETQVPQEEIEDVIKKVENEIANDTCQQCGKRKHPYDYCSNCQVKCTDCQSIIAVNEVLYLDGSSPYCSRCISSCAYCGTTGLTRSMLSHGGSHYCYNCIEYCSGCFLPAPAHTMTPYGHNGYYCASCIGYCNSCFQAIPKTNLRTYHDLMLCLNCFLNYTYGQ